jgi:uncharacterized GH25 family protein
LARPLPFIVAALVLLAAAWMIFLAPGSADDGIGSEGSSLPEQPVALGGPNPEVAPSAVHTDNGSGRIELEPDREAEFATAGGVRGTVINSQGNPVPGASVVLNFRPTAAFFDLSALEPSPLFRRTTNQEGIYQFKRLPSGKEFEMWVHHENYAPTQGIPVSCVPGEEQVLGPVVLGPGYRVYGRVSDTGGNPLQAQVHIELQSRTARAGDPAKQAENDRALGRIVETATDKDGGYEIPRLAQGVWTLTATCPGFGAGRIMPVLLMGEEVESRQNLELGPEIVLGGVVVDANGQPVEGAKVSVSRTRPRPLFGAETLTGKGGKFLVEGLPEGVYGVAARAEGFSFGRAPRVDSGTRDLKIVLEALGGVTGRVTDPDGRAVSKFQVEALRINRNTAQYGFTGKTWDFDDADGNFMIQDLENGRSFVLLVRSKGFAPTHSAGFYVEGDIVRGVDVILKFGGRLIGTVTSAVDGKGLAGAEISLHGKDYDPNVAHSLFGAGLDPNNIPPTSVKSGKNGAFLMEGAFPGPMMVQVHHPSFLPYFRSISLSDGSTLDMGTQQLEPGGVVEGTVYSADGIPLAGGRVYLSRRSQEGGFLAKTATLDSRGHFRFQGLPAGTFDLSASSAKAEATLLFPPGVEKQVFVAPGKTSEVKLTVPR